MLLHVDRFAAAAVLREIADAMSDDRGKAAAIADVADRVVNDARRPAPMHLTALDVRAAAELPCGSPDDAEILALVSRVA